MSSSHLAACLFCGALLLVAFAIFLGHDVKLDFRAPGTAVTLQTEKGTGAGRR